MLGLLFLESLKIQCYFHKIVVRVFSNYLLKRTIINGLQSFGNNYI